MGQVGGAAIAAPPTCPGFKPDENAICPGQSLPEYDGFYFADLKFGLAGNKFVYPTILRVTFISVTFF